VRLRRRLVGQPQAIETITPYVQMHEAKLSPLGRPAGVFLLLGPTGTGKTRTIEVLAAELHCSEKCHLRIDCAEFQMEHEVAKLIGAPPGYLGHRETHPMITQQKLEATKSEPLRPSLVLFDEIEKAAPSMYRLLLGVLDKGILHLGDNSVVNFEDSLIFLTSNLGARGMQTELRSQFGFGAGEDGASIDSRLNKAALSAVRKHFAPEFLNRMDAVVDYRPLEREALRKILDLQLKELSEHIERRFGSRSFSLHVTDSAADRLVRLGTSAEYGARELKRTIHRHVIQPLAARVTAGGIRPGVTVRIRTNGDQLRLEVQDGENRPRGCSEDTPTALRLPA
jgi:ATP-dependent Clp protease ATP-binding subunit ClpA